MKQRTAVLFLLAVGSSAALAQPQTVEFSLFISVPKKQVILGAPIPLTIKMTNTASHDIYWGQFLNEKRIPFLITILDQHNEIVTQTAYGKEMSGVPRDGVPLGGSVFMVTLPRGKSVSEEVMLNKEYEINRKGTYRIQVERMAPSGIHVKSNAIVLNVR
jgi:hypothetical protein